MQGCLQRDPETVAVFLSISKRMPRWVPSYQTAYFKLLTYLPSMTVNLCQSIHENP